MKKLITISIITLISLFSLTTFAQRQEGTVSSISKGTDSTRQEGTSNPADNGSPSIKLDNPLKGSGIDSVPTLIEKILEIVLTIGTPLVAIMIIYSGYLFVAARGVPGEIEKAKATLQYTLIGAAILLGAYVIAEAIVGTVCAIKGGSC